MKTSTPPIPELVRQVYAVTPEANVEQLTGGLVNQTLAVEDGGYKTIFRCLSGVLDPAVLEDTQAVGDHLTNKGWEAPTVVPTLAGALYVRDDDDRIWHRMNYITSDGRTSTTHNRSLTEAAGMLLGAWHASTRNFDYTPKFSIPHFHDSEYHAAKFKSLADEFKDGPTRDLAQHLSEKYVPPSEDHDQPKQIIHGDPKLDNMLFRNGRPFTLIDFDTVMHASPMVDVGDFLRSINGKLLQQNALSVDTTGNFVSAYRDANESKLSQDHMTVQALQATGRIAVELGMRYLCDIVDGVNYFSWDKDKYERREDHHRDKALLQLQVAEFALQASRT